jgi:hypothetical protein
LAFLRFSRDKRGVENFSLIQPTTNRRGKVRPRLLYWFRSPPDVKVGREPFDAFVRRALEAQNPGVDFDWRAIVETPIPSADADKWRERRRADRAAKHAAAEEESAEAGHLETQEGGAAAAMPEHAVEVSEVAIPPAAAPSEPGASRSGGDANRKRRRRRRSGGGRDNVAAAPQTPSSTDPAGD